MTYQALLNKLLQLDQTQLLDTVTVLDYEANEYYSVERSYTAIEDDVLNKDHFFLVIKDLC